MRQIGTNNSIEDNQFNGIRYQQTLPGTHSALAAPVIKSHGDYMSNFLKWISKLSFVSFILGAQAQAYDIDTHLRMTYASARMVGINHEVSLLLAMSSQWNDVSALTTPMGSLVVGSRLRRLFHFPASRSVQIDNAGAHGSINFNKVTKAYRLDPMGSELIMEGMKKGYLPFVGNGIHTLQDTFGHEGYTAEMGHAYAGHEPDRPWRNWPKYKEMSLNVIRAMISIRELLPEEALDFNTLQERGLWTSSTNKNNAQQITDLFLKKIEPTVSNDIFKDPRYTKAATRYILQQLRANQFLISKTSIESLMDDTLFDGQKNLQQIFSLIVNSVLEKEISNEKIMNQKMLLNDILRGYPLNQNQDIFAQIATYPEDIQKNIRNRIVMLILDKHIPDQTGTTALGFSNNFVWEPDNNLRNLEMELRMQDWRKLTLDMYGKNWEFIEPEGSKFSQLLTQNVKSFFDLIKKSKSKAKGFIFTQTTDEEIRQIAEQELETQVKEFAALKTDLEFVAFPKKMASKWVRMIITFTWLDMLKGSLRFKPQDHSMAWLFVDKIKELQQAGKVKQLIEAEEVLALSEKIILQQKDFPTRLRSALKESTIHVRCEGTLL